MQARRPRRFDALLAGVVVGAMLFSIAVIDRPVAYLMFRHFHESRAPFILPTRIVDVLEVLAAIGLLWSGFNHALRRPFGRTGQIVLRTSLALFVAIGVKDLLKLAFGRTWPETWTCGNPSLIRDAAYAFSPFHGGAGWASFPSGHQTLTCAVAACLWVLAPRFRPAYVLVALTVAVSLLFADFHFVSDVLAGSLAGWMVGLFVARVDLTKAQPLA
ncbi:phosphatase PAP2 family protein [uncultured Rhodoblastus sp.]|uniref:phosphatase PAP2 family protein n=1 Tax=uncultured Rhodoblastus sp. TaxID=543037 RepID=UPI0025E6B1DA|nr:phosphatase PAP2 family protein [uncultured Rhodoblastus sp.]